MRIISWFKKLLRIVREFDAALQQVRSEAQKANDCSKTALDLIRANTTVHLDLSPGRHDPDVVIMVGRYQNKDYVQVFSLPPSDFTGLLDHLRSLSRQGVFGRIDAPAAFRAVIDRDYKF